MMSLFPNYQLLRIHQRLDDFKKVTHVFTKKNNEIFFVLFSFYLDDFDKRRQKSDDITAYFNKNKHFAAL